MIHVFLVRAAATSPFVQMQMPSPGPGQTRNSLTALASSGSNRNLDQTVKVKLTLRTLAPSHVMADPCYGVGPCL